MNTIKLSEATQLLKKALIEGQSPQILINGEYYDVEKEKNHYTPAEIEVKTTAGVLKAYACTYDPTQPGIVVMLNPVGCEEEIDLSYVTVYEDPAYATSENERPVDVAIMTYGNPLSEDYTSKKIIRREDVLKGLGLGENTVTNETLLSLIADNIPSDPSKFNAVLYVQKGEES